MIVAVPRLSWLVATFVVVALCRSDLVWSTSDMVRTRSDAAKCVLDPSVSYVTCNELGVGSVDALKQALSDAATIFGTFNLEVDNSAVLELPVDVLDGYHVQEIRFSQDNLGSIPYLLLSHLDSELVHLYLWKQNMSTINRPAANLPFKNSLQEINLSYNLATSIEKGAFSDFTALTALSLYDNLLAGLTPDDLTGLTSLRTLQLERNLITTIASGAFADLGQLNSLNLSFNALQTLQDGAFDGLQSLTFIGLQGNPFFCECPLQWLKDWLNETGLLASSQATCFYPLYGPFSDVEFCP